MTDLLTAAGVLLVADQWSKHLVQVCADRRCLSYRLLRIRSVISRKAIYERDLARVLLVLLWLLSAASALALYGFLDQFQQRAAVWGLGAAIGGAAGNLVDILRRRYVFDFIDLRWWPAFNLADAGIVCGLIMAFWPYY